MIFLVLCLVAFGVACASAGSTATNPQNKERSETLKKASGALTLAVIIASLLRRD